MTHPLQPQQHPLLLKTATAWDTPTIYITLYSDTPRFSFYAYLQCSPAERNSFSLTVRWGWTTSYQTVALDSELSDGLIKTHYLLCIFVMTFTDVLHCSGRLVISIKTYLNDLSTFISRSQKILITFFSAAPKDSGFAQCLHMCCHSLERQDETSFSSPCALVILGLITNFK